LKPEGEEEDYGDDEYFDGSDDPDLDVMLKMQLQRQQQKRQQQQQGDSDDVISIASDDVSIASSDDVIDDVIGGDRKSSVIDQLREDFEKFSRMRRDKDKLKVEPQRLY